MIVFKVNVEGIFTVECECHAPVAANRNSPSPGSIAFQPVQAITRQGHIRGGTSPVKHVELPPQTLGKFGGHSAPLARFKEPLQSFMAKALYHAFLIVTPQVTSSKKSHPGKIKKERVNRRSSTGVASFASQVIDESSAQRYIVTSIDVDALAVLRMLEAAIGIEPSCT